MGLVNPLRAPRLCYMQTTLVYLQRGKVKKSKNLIKIVNTDKENLHIFRKISVRFSGKMCLMIKLKVTKNQDFTYCLVNTLLEKLQGVKLSLCSLFMVKFSKVFKSINAKKL